MTPAAARARCAELDLRPWDPIAIRAEVARASAALLQASPQVTPLIGAPGMWWIGASGFDTLGGEAALAAALQAIASTWHPDARVAIADSCVAARAATWDERAARDTHGTHGTHGTERMRRRPLVIPTGHDAEYLADVPLALLPMPAPLRASLLALGFRTGGGFAALEPRDVEQRWGVDGLAAWRMARGEDPRRPHLARADADRTVHAELGSSTDTTEPLLFLVRGALDRLVGASVADGRAVAAIALTLTLDGGARTITRDVRPAAPVGRTAPLFEQCRAVLSSWALPAPVQAITVRIAATAPLAGRQGDLLDASWRDIAAVEAALARLRAELGALSVVVPAAVDAHLPERAAQWVDADAAIPAPPLEPPPTAPPADGRAVRVLDPPEPAEVETIAHRPTVLRWRARRIPLVRLHGPERLDGAWWHTPVARDYWRCADGEAREYVVYADRNTKQWYVQGWVD
jgi:protein ImuB